MSRRTLTETEVVELIEEAQKQLDEYLKIAELSTAVAAADSFTSPHNYSWDSPLGLVISETDVNGFVVRATE